MLVHVIAAELPFDKAIRPGHFVVNQIDDFAGIIIFAGLIGKDLTDSVIYFALPLAGGSAVLGWLDMGNLALGALRLFVGSSGELGINSGVIRGL